MEKEKRIENIILTTVIIVLLMIFSIFIWSINIKRIFNMTSITDSIQIILTFVGVFSTFLGAYLGAKLSGDKALEISREEREEQKIKDIFIFQREREIKVQYLSKILGEKMPGNFYSRSQGKNKMEELKHIEGIIQLFDNKIDIVLIERLSDLEENLSMLKMQPGMMYCTESETSVLENLIFSLRKFRFNYEMLGKENMNETVKVNNRNNMRGSLEDIYINIFIILYEKDIA